MSNLFNTPPPPPPPPPEPATSAQIERLARHGIRGALMTRRQAGAALGRLKGKLTPKQTAALGAAGEDLKCTPEKAHALLSILAARRWKPRDYLLLANRWFVREKARADPEKPASKEWMVVFYEPDAGLQVPMGRRFRTQAAARAFVAACVEDAEKPGGRTVLADRSGELF